MNKEKNITLFIYVIYTLENIKRKFIISIYDKTGKDEIVWIFLH